MVNRSPSVSRRTALASGVTSLVALAGCSAVGSVSEPATLDRILLRADTGKTESLELILEYAPRDDSTENLLWGFYEAPGSGEVVEIRDFEGEPGFYSLTAHSEQHDDVVVGTFNSHGDAVGSGPLQYEIVVKQNGTLWRNLNDADSEIRIPGYDG